MIPAAAAQALRPPTAGEQLRVQFENEPDALFTVVPAEGGGLAVVTASGASDKTYGFDLNEDEWRHPGPAQIVENRETQLSSPFLGPGDNFPKSYDENQIRYNFFF
jgi:hypothetical protein